MRVSRMIAVTAVTALAFTSVAVTPASAHHWHHGRAAVLGAVLGLFGTVAAIAAADRYNDDYYAYGYGGPYYYVPYGYYGGGYSGYAPHYRGGFRGHHYAYHHHHHH
jgi:hypothetical protein